MHACTHIAGRHDCMQAGRQASRLGVGRKAGMQKNFDGLLERVKFNSKYGLTTPALLRVWQICFRHNFSKKLSLGPKNGLERRPSRFSTICAKTQVLKLNIDKVTVILRRKSPSAPWHAGYYGPILLIPICYLVHSLHAIPLHVQEPGTELAGLRSATDRRTSS